MSAKREGRRLAFDRAMRHAEALALFCDGVAPSEVDARLGLEAGMTRKAVLDAWRHDLPMGPKDWKGA